MLPVGSNRNRQINKDSAEQFENTKKIQLPNHKKKSDTFPFFLTQTPINQKWIESESFPGK